ncbi:MAG: TIGR04211 family SH3 domain-containing protein [Methylococcales bacterium]|nr:TIGR04211 family SH3 domain-containing protein [Methylococcales bacterium]
MKTILSAFLILILTFGLAEAETVYVTTNLALTLKSEESMRGKVLQTLAIGTPLTVIKVNKKSGFTRVRTINGIEGFIESRHITTQLPVLNKNETSSKLIESLQTENTALKTELTQVKSSITPGTTLEQSLANERDKLKRELGELKMTSSNCSQLKNERDDLRERFVSADRELQQLKLENQALKDSASQDWFLYGGILALAGVILGFILPKLGWRRKNSWDSF